MYFLVGVLLKSTKFGIEIKFKNCNGFKYLKYRTQKSKIFTLLIFILILRNKKIIKKSLTFLSLSSTSLSSQLPGYLHPLPVKHLILLQTLINFRIKFCDGLSITFSKLIETFLPVLENTLLTPCLKCLYLFRCCGGVL